MKYPKNQETFINASLNPSWVPTGAKRRFEGGAADTFNVHCASCSLCTLRSLRRSQRGTFTHTSMLLSPEKKCFYAVVSTVLVLWMFRHSKARGTEFIFSPCLHDNWKTVFIDLLSFQKGSWNIRLFAPQRVPCTRCVFSVHTAARTFKEYRTLESVFKMSLFQRCSPENKPSAEKRQNGIVSTWKCCVNRAWIGCLKTCCNETSIHAILHFL